MVLMENLAVVLTETLLFLLLIDPKLIRTQFPVKQLNGKVVCIDLTYQVLLTNFVGINESIPISSLHEHFKSARLEAFAGGRVILLCGAGVVLFPPVTLPFGGGALAFLFCEFPIIVVTLESSFGGLNLEVGGAARAFLVVNETGEVCVVPDVKGLAREVLADLDLVVSIDCLVVLLVLILDESVEVDDVDDVLWHETTKKVAEMNKIIHNFRISS